MSQIADNVDRIEVPVPCGSKLLLVELPAGCSQRVVDDIANAVKARTLDHWREHPNEPAVLVVTKDITVRWLEADVAQPKLPSKLGTTTTSPMTTLAKGAGPPRQRKATK